MKILHIISQHPESTGSGFYLQNVIRQASGAGHENFLVAGISGNRLPALDCIAPASCRFVRFNSGALDFDIPGMSDVMPYRSMRYRDLSVEQLSAYGAAFAETIRAAAMQFQPDIIHSHHLWLVSSIAREVLPELPMVTSCHSSDLRQFQQCPHLQEKVLPYCRKIGRVLALSKEQANEVNSLYDIPKQCIDVVGGGYAKEVFRYREKKKAPPVNLLYAGKLSFAKGVEWLLQAFIALDDQNLHLHLVGSGTGMEAQRCLELAEEAGTRVTVHGRMGQSELAEIMACSHIFILPSFYEGLPLVILEAIAAGCRIVTTNLPGCQQVLKTADRDLVRLVALPVMMEIDKPRQEDMPVLGRQLAKAITDMADCVRQNPSPSVGEISRITSSYSWQAVFSRILSSYESVMAGS